MENWLFFEAMKKIFVNRYLLYININKLIININKY